MKIEITASDIRSGVPMSPWYCPVAMAIRRAIGERNIFSVDVVEGGRIEIRGERLASPPEAVEFVNKFDRYGASGVSPMSFELAYNPGDE